MASSKRQMGDQTTAAAGDTGRNWARSGKHRVTWSSLRAVGCLGQQPTAARSHQCRRVCPEASIGRVLCCTGRPSAGLAGRAGQCGHYTAACWDRFGTQPRALHAVMLSALCSAHERTRECHAPLPRPRGTTRARPAAPGRPWYESAAGGGRCAPPEDDGGRPATPGL